MISVHIPVNGPYKQSQIELARESVQTKDKPFLCTNHLLLVSERKTLSPGLPN
jgi:hypothetical protein